MTKAKRQSLLVELLDRGEIESQLQAMKVLKSHGIRVTQATISRDFEELGVTRGIRSDTQGRYTLSSERSQFGAPLPVVLRDYVVRVQSSGNIIVFHTPPGHANVVAAAIDRSQVQGVLGVVAGDDTLFVCVDEKIGTKRTLRNLQGDNS